MNIQRLIETFSAMFCSILYTHLHLLVNFRGLWDFYSCGCYLVDASVFSFNKKKLFEIFVIVEDVNLLVRVIHNYHEF